jgi:prepilin-type N-terminal cleavage/methylation domain-containing protein
MTQGAGRRGGFTLTEILIVIGIIVLILAMAVPAFNYITGTRSQEAATNIIAAMLSRARTEAINYQRNNENSRAYVGVFFFVDPADNRTKLVLVAREVGSGEDPDPYDNYKAWRPGVEYRTTPYKDRVIFMVRHDGEQMAQGPNGNPPADSNPRAFFKRFRCTEDHTSSGGNCPPLNGPQPEGYFHNQYWEEVVEGDLEILKDSEVQVLPAGVGVQLVNDTRGGVNTDRYVRTGVILFDPQGRLDSVEYAVSSNTALGKLVGVTSLLQGTPAEPLVSQFGVVTYDLAQFRGQNFTEGDALFNLPTLVRPGRYNPDEAAEEQWLDNNASILMVNRTTAALQKTE